jgi:hypothetical protein
LLEKEKLGIRFAQLYFHQMYRMLYLHLHSYCQINFRLQNNPHSENKSTTINWFDTCSFGLFVSQSRRVVVAVAFTVVK